MRYVLALDQGTTGSTALVVSQDGEVVARGYREITQHYPQPGWVEHDPEELLQATCAAARDAIAAAGVKPECVGITNQRETVVLWDRETGKPVAPAIVWQDRRTSQRCAELAPHASMIAKKTGLVTDPYFSASKLEWLLANAEVGDPSRLLAGTIDTWLIWRLTGGTTHATDPTNASRTMLYDIEQNEWSSWACELFGIPRSLLPCVRPSSGSFGVARAEHFGIELPILGVAGDQQAALYGQGCVREGQAKNTYGTGAFLLLNTGPKRASAGDGLLTTLACGPRGEATFALEASIFIAGAAVQWLRDGLGIIKAAPETQALAESLPSNEGVYFVPALTGLGAPHWEADARGTVVGLTRGTTRAHLARAALEAMAFGTADVIDTMRAHASGALDILRVDGGAAANDWLMQFQSDVLGVPVERPDSVETTALGAAALAGVAAGIWKDADEFVAPRRFMRFAPNPDMRDAAAQGRKGWSRAVRATLSWTRDRE